MLQKWCEITTCNGIIDLYEARNNKIRLLFWVIVMTFMIGASVYFTYQTILGYILSPTVTNVATVSQSLMEMPDTTICYNGGLNAEAMRNESWSDDLITDFNFALYDLLDDPSIKSQEEFGTYLNRKIIDVKSVLDLFGYKCNDLVNRFEGPQNSYDCINNVDTITSVQGKCYVFKNITSQYFPGLSGGIRVILKAPTNSFFDLFQTDLIENGITKDFSITMEKRMGLQLTGRSLLIPTNVKAEVTLNPKRYKRLSSGGQCNDNPSFYSSNSCYYKCYLTQVMKSCQCTHLPYWDENETPKNVSICNPLTFYKMCWPKVNDHIAVFTSCQTKCKPLCDEWLFESTVSYSLLQPKWLNKSTSFVHIGYSTMQHTKIEEVAAYSMDMAIANVGGQSGLWLGASFVTFIQAVYYIFLSIKKRFNSSPHVSCSK